MKTWFHSWRAAVRIARRDAWRFKGRSFLVLAMLTLPILGVGAADLTYRSSELSVAETLTRDMGRSDARISDPELGGAPLYQGPDGNGYRPVGDFENKPYPEGPADLEKGVPAGATTLEDSTGTGKLRTSYGLLPTEIRELKASDPMAEGIMRLTEGRFPQRSGEIAATTHFLEAGKLSVGDSVTARGLDTSYRIVGAYELPSNLNTDQVNALPGTFLAPLDKALKADELPGVESSTTHLVKISGGFTWNMVKETNKHGLVVTSRAVALNPPALSDVPLYQEAGESPYDSGGGIEDEEMVILATVVGLAMLEICLLAGPAFAVGARRSRRQLGLVGANGGDRSHIRAVVLAGGLVIGVASAVVGTVLAFGLTVAVRPLMEEYLGQRFEGLDIRPLELLGIALIAVVTGLLAAIVPAITASRQTVLASLTGRRGVRKSSRVLPVLGLIATALGAAIALYGTTLSSQVTLVAAGSALAELGVVAMTPALVGFFGRAGRWMPLSPRLALRDAVRNRGRTAPAVAAVLAAVAGSVAVATYAASDDAEQRAKYESSLPYGAVSAVVDDGDSRDVPAVRDAIQKNLSIDVRADVDRVLVGKAGCRMYYGGEDGCGSVEIAVPKANVCPLWAPDVQDAELEFSAAERRKLMKDPRCEENNDYSGIEAGILIGGPEVLDVLGIKDPAAKTALADGRAVSFNKFNLQKDGKVGIRLIMDSDAAQKAISDGKEAPGEVKSIAAHQVKGDPRSYGAEVLMTPATAKAAGLKTAPVGAYYSTSTLPSSEQQQKLNSDLDKLGSSVSLRVEQGYVGDSNTTLLVLTVFAGLITLGAAAIATGLAQADAEADLKTLEAVGAPSRVRRTLSGFQCGVVATMGVVLGSLAGVLPAVALRLTERRSAMEMFQESLDEALGTPSSPYTPIVIPWETLGGLLIVVPLVATVLAALVTRSNGSMGRRAVT
ncbi:FtsX-like permease family protein [Streptomyces hebeiensis]